MCGLAGYIGTRPPSSELVDKCLTAMRRRGPDGAGVKRVIFTHPFRPAANLQAVLLHSRLAIIDPLSGHQPMSEGNYHLVFNGEVYTYKERRAELEKDGVVFSSNSDTEVLFRICVRAAKQRHLRRFADELSSLNGIWAFVFVDSFSGEVYFSRDHFGKKPLYIYPLSHGIHFGSCPSFISILSGEKLKPDFARLELFSVCGYRAFRGASFFRGLEEVPPASLLRYGVYDGAWQVARFSLPASYAPRKMTGERAASKVLDLIAHSLSLRLRSDRPVAFLQSGGVDSNALVAIAKRVLGASVCGFCIDHGDASYSEVNSAIKVAKSLGTRLEVVPLPSRGFFEALREMTCARWSPVLAPAYFAHFFLMREIAPSYRVVISGTGADEVFSGYYDHHLYNIARLEEQGRAKGVEESWRSFVLGHVRNPNLKDPARFVRSPYFRGYLFAGSHPGLCLCPEEYFCDDPLRNRMLNEVFYETVPVMLREEDRNAMWFSLENRSPYLDKDIWRFALRIPTDLLINDLAISKWVLRKAVERFLPKEVVWQRRKVGFNAPIWLISDLKEVGRWLMDGSSYLGDFSSVISRHKDRVKAICSFGCRLSDDDAKFLFNFAAVKMFLEVVDEVL